MSLHTEKQASAALLTAERSDYSRVMVPAGKTALSDERALIEQAQNSDALAFESLYRLHVDKVYGICLRMTGNVAEAEDCAQDAFIQAWNKLAKFRGDSAFSTWLHRIAVNAVLGRMRKSKREQDRLVAVAENATPLLATGHSSEMRDLSEAVVLLIGASSGVTYMVMRDNAPPAVVHTPEMLFEQASFGNRYSLGPGFQDARSSLVAELEFELQNLSPESRNDIEFNLRLIHDVISDMNNALAEDPENLLLQERLLRTYREELSLLRRISGLTRNIMMKNDI